jgi:pimeloyl-ACP methyl ester carboxylesterase
LSIPLTPPRGIRPNIDRVVLVHGSLRGPEDCWRKQLPLAKRWHVLLPARPTIAINTGLDVVDYERDAALLLPTLDEPAHLAGHSAGGLVALLMAAMRPAAVKSLTLIEPVAFSAASDVECVARLVRDLFAAQVNSGDDVADLRRFVDLLGIAYDVPDSLDEATQRSLALGRKERLAWGDELPFEAVRAARIPSLVISGAHSQAFEAICDAVATAIGAARAQIPGKGHSVPQCGDALNAMLEDFWLRSGKSR